MVESTEPTAAVVRTFTEWDPLEEVIVGTVQGAVYPEYGPILAANGDPAWLEHYAGAFVEEELVEHATEQLDTFVAILEGEGVVVRRPDPVPHHAGFSTPWWQSRSGWNSANPRDLFLVVGDQIIECASPLRHRYFEAQAYRRVLRTYFRAGARWSAAPAPTLREPLYDYSALAEPEAHRPRLLGADESHHYPITEHEPVFEAADFIRCGLDLFAIQSTVTNRSGIAWVERHLGESFRIHQLQTRQSNPCHIDTTFIPLCPGVALVHPQWFTKAPPCLKDWTLLPAPPPEYHPESPMATPYFTSQWLSMNLFSLDSKRVFVDDQQQTLIRLLRQHHFEPIPIAFDAVGAFGGSFHCATLDIRRRGGLERYVASP
ncbi:MAG: amidinotransferase [Myxococcota bacterium]